MRFAAVADVTRMRDQLFFEGPDLRRRMSRFWLLLVLSAVIASAGVVADSTATVIGAMIVAPLMVPILGTVVAVVLADRRNLLISMGMVLAGALAVIAIAFVIGLILSEPVLASNNSQVASRVSPRLIDLVAALATGAVGSIALARDDISDTLPGVAIAISLVPPLAVVGLTLESGAPAQSFGALLLFVTNVSAILVSGLVVMTAYRVTRHATVESEGTTKPVHRVRAAGLIVASILVISVPLAATSVSISRSQSHQSQVTDLADEWAARTGWEIAAVSSKGDRFVVRATGGLPEPETDSLRDALLAADLGGVNVSIELIPSSTHDLVGHGDEGSSDPDVGSDTTLD
jgi:uncharacterized hydrophobic protein (TIGR00271 family)